MNKSISDIYPLTATQQGMLFHAIQSSKNSAYVIQLRLEINGLINHQIAQQAWQLLIARHPVLRTAFIWEKQQQVLQVVGKTAQLQYKVHQYEHQHLDLQLIESFLKTDRESGFELNKAPLFRINSFEFSEQKTIMIFSFHHIILDGWSMPLILKEFLYTYKQLTNKNLDLTTTVNEQNSFKQYIAWYHQWQKNHATEAFNYWKNSLASLENKTEIQLLKKAKINNKNISDRSSYGQCEIIIDKQKTEKINALSKQQRCTVNTLLLSVWAILLHRMSQDETVLFGTTKSGRPNNLEGIETAVGMFIHTTPLTATISKDLTVEALIKQLSDRQIEQQAYDLLPLIEIQKASNISAQNLLFDSIIVFENYPKADDFSNSIEDLTISAINITEQTNYPLSWYIVMQETLSIKALFDANIYDRNTIQGIVNYFNNVLNEILNNVSQKIATLNYLPEQEVKQQTQQWNKALALSENPHLLSSFKQQVNNHPQAIAAVCNKQTISYAELDVKSNQLAHYLKSKIQHNQAAIGLCMERSIDMLLALLAILKAGHFYVPMDANFPSSRLSYYVENSGLALVLCHQQTNSLVQSLLNNSQQNEIINYQADIDRINQQAISPLDSVYNNEQLAYLIYTSGSTGKPKGVPITHHNFSNLLNSFKQQLICNHQDALLAVTTFSFDIANLELLLPIISGSKLVIATEKETQDAKALNNLLHSYNISIMQATPSTWRLLVESGWSGNKDLKILCGGEALEKSLAEKLFIRCKTLWNVYGPTETTIWSAALAITEDHLTYKNIPIGQAIANTELSILDSNQQLLAPGLSGELCIAGDGLSPGYYKNESLNKDRFIRNPTNPQQILYRTGDEVRYNDNGSIEYLGRIDQQIKLRGYRIELPEIENILQSHESVDQAICVIHGEGEQAKITAYLKLAYNNSANEQALRTFAETQLPYYMLPTVYQFTDSFPLTLNGKIDRKTLSNQRLIQEERKILTPGNNTESLLLNIWQELLDQQNISTTDNFFDLGGHSLLLMRMQEAIKKCFSVDFEIVDLFRYTNIKSLSKAIDDRKSLKAKDVQQDLQTSSSDSSNIRKKRLQAQRTRRQNR